MRKSHIPLGGRAVPRYLLLPGDPNRVPLIGLEWSSYEEVSFNREFRFARGTIENVKLGACSTGIGAPSVEIAFMELAAAGADTFMRVGTCGALQPEITPGTLVIHEGAFRSVGAVNAYCKPEYPAIADRDVTFALIEACEQLGVSYAVGLTASTDSFFAGQNNTLPDGLPTMDTYPFADEARSYGILTFEMEAAALFILGSLFKSRCGSVCVVGSNRATGERREIPDGIRDAVAVANRAVSILFAWDALRKESNCRYLSASLLTGRVPTRKTPGDPEKA